MIKRNNYKSLLIGIFVVALTSQLWAQKTKALSDTTTIETKSSKVVPGLLYNLASENSTAAVSTVSGETLYKTSTPNLLNTLYGRLPGLTVNQGSGEPGNDGPDMAVRGVGTNSLGNLYNTYKIYVDGFQVYSNYLSFISANDIESVSILKDAASLAQFGMEGANGVIWVVTKKGEGKLKISFNARSGSQNAIVINKPLNSYDYANLYNQAISNDKGVWSPKYLQADLDAYKNGTGTNVDWFDQVLRKNGAYSDGNLNVSGGDKNVKYFVGFNYGNQQGLFNVNNTDSTSNSQFTTYSVRANLSFKISKLFESRVGMYARLEDRKTPNYSTSQLFTDIANYPANIYPVRDGNTTNYSGTSIYPNNPVASLNAQGWTSSRNRFIQGNFGLKENLDFITDGLYLDESVSELTYSRSTYSKTRNYGRYIGGIIQTTTQPSALGASSLGAAGQDDWKQGKLMLGYDRAFGKNHIQMALAYNISQEIGEGNFGYKVNTENFNGKLNYSYKNTYVAELGFSYYGSDAYSPANQWAFYPTVSGAWIVSNEKFLQNNEAISYLKVRASAGATGQTGSTVGNGISNYSTNGRYLYQQYYQNTGSFYTGAATQSSAGGLVPMYIANTSLTAEKSLKYNIGLDFALFKRLSIGVDAFMDKRSDIPVIDNTIPTDFGNNTAIKNLGRMTNKGIDADLNYTDKVGDVGYSVIGMVSLNQNVIDYTAEIPTAYPYNAITGRPYGSPIGLVSNGFYQVEDFNSDGTLKSSQPIPFFGKVQPGDLKYKDLNNDNVIDQNDVTAIGKSALPEFIYSFGLNLTYKSFDLSVLFQGAGGSSVNILSSAATQVQAFVNNTNAFPIAKGAWAYYPDQGIDTRSTATYPRLTTVSNTNNYRTSSFWMKDNDYLRIRNIELGYTLNPKLISSVGLSKCRIFVNSANPVTWSKLLTDYKIDPETYGGYPSLSSFNAGISVSF